MVKNRPGNFIKRFSEMTKFRRGRMTELEVS